ncbi:MAG: DUF192 domain-containing protein [Alphaproteobacteria bacterium]
MNQRKKLFYITVIIMPFISLLVINALETRSTNAENLNNNVFDKTTISIISGNEEHNFVVEIADDQEKRAQGLMFRKSLGKKEGMIFDFGITTPIKMWMKHTYIPLDMVFISENGDVADIIPDTIPFSEAVLAPKIDTRYVLEISGGICNELKINIGDKVKGDFFNK